MRYFGQKLVKEDRTQVQHVPLTQDDVEQVRLVLYIKELLFFWDVFTVFLFTCGSIQTFPTPSENQFLKLRVKLRITAPLLWAVLLRSWPPAALLSFRLWSRSRPSSAPPLLGSAGQSWTAEKNKHRGGITEGWTKMMDRVGTKLWIVGNRISWETINILLETDLRGLLKTIPLPRLQLIGHVLQ